MDQHASVVFLLEKAGLPRRCHFDAVTGGEHRVGDHLDLKVCSANEWRVRVSHEQESHDGLRGGRVDEQASLDSRPVGPGTLESDLPSRPVTHLPWW